MKRIVSPPLSDRSRFRQKLTPGEGIVLDLFDRCLAPEWEIYLQPHLNGLRPDFVLLNPAVGIAVFEVKDWNLDAMRYFTRTDGKDSPRLWAEKDGTEFCIQSNNPITKVNLYRQEIYELYCPRLGKNGRRGRHDGWAAITAGIIFPFATAARVKCLLSPFQSEGDSGGYAKYQPIAGSDDIASDRMQCVFPESARAQSRLMSNELAQDLRGWLVEPDISASQRMPLELDRRQRELADAPTESGYRRIKGPAGSGKSLVLAARAAKLMTAGKKVLIITFNITLWHYLRDLIVRTVDSPEKMRNVRFSHFHHWCKHVCFEVGWEQEYDGLVKTMAAASRDELRITMIEGLPALAAKAIEQPAATKYDAILVDEGQDFYPNWWGILRRAHVKDGEMMLVADATQDIYGTATAWTDQVMHGAGFRGEWAKLDVSYRLPPRALEIAREFACQFLPEATTVLPKQETDSLDLYPCELRWVQCSPDIAPLACVDEILALMKLTSKSGLANADITFLSADAKVGTVVTDDLENQYGIRTVSTYNADKIEQRREKMGFYMGDARLKATTLHSFKGWEARLLVIYIAQATNAATLALIYAGLTRLKRHVEGSWLTVVCSAHELESFGSTWPSFSQEEQGIACRTPHEVRLSHESTARDK